MSIRFGCFLLLFLGLSLGLASCASSGYPSPEITGTSRQITLPITPTSRLSSTPSPTFTRRVTSLPKTTFTPTQSVIPQPSASSTAPLCLKKSGRIITASLTSKWLKLPLEYRVYLPPCYEQEKDQRYPVLYLIHGQSFTDDQWDRLGADETADRLIASGEVAPFLIVMPRDRYGGQPSETHFGQVVAKELLPLIDWKYRTLHKRADRAVGGLSRGAGWSVHLALTYWELFGALGSHSPAIFFDDAQHMRPLLDAIPRDSMPRIYVDVGDKDRPEIMQAALWFEQLLNERDIPHEWHMFSGYHEEAYWEEHIEQYLLWYAGEW